MKCVDGRPTASRFVSATIYAELSTELTYYPRVSGRPPAFSQLRAHRR